MGTTSHLIESFAWTQDISNRKEKECIAGYIAGKVKDGDIVGVGSGSTSYLALLALAKRVREEKFHIKAIPTSFEISLFCIQQGIPLTSLQEHLPDWSFDGVDEVDPENNLLKGRGGAMFKEKLLLSVSSCSYILADASKRVSELGTYFPVPVEVFPFALHCVEKQLMKLSVKELALRQASGKDGPVFTENGNLILDVRFKEIYPDLEKELSAIPGVVESGLFIHYPQVRVIDDQTDLTSVFP